MKYCHDVLTAKVKNISRSNGTVYFGQGLKDNAIVNSFNLNPSSKVFHKIVKNKCLYESSTIQKKRSNNSFVLLSDGRFAQIHAFILNGNDEQTICSIVRVKYFYENFKTMYVVDCFQSERICFPTSSITKICVVFKVFEKTYICPIPNLLHY